jgi:hypothetical protein
MNFTHNSTGVPDVFEAGGVAYRWEPLCALRDALPAASRKAPRRPPPSTPGLYRLRRVGRTELDYIGQTGSGGMTLRKRVRMLASIMARSPIPRSAYRGASPMGVATKGGVRLRGECHRAAGR